MKIAVLMKSERVGKSLRQALVNATCEVHECESRIELFRLCRQRRVSVVLLEKRGEPMRSCVRSLHLQFGESVCVIVLGDGEPGAIVDALAAGAADYVNIHDAPKEIASRVLARLSRERKDRPVSLQVGNCILNSITNTLHSGQHVVRLTAREFAVAWLLFERSGLPVATSTIADVVWGRDAEMAKRTIEQHVHKLRRKLSKDDAFVLQISTHYGVGYSVHAPQADAAQLGHRDAVPPSRQGSPS